MQMAWVVLGMAVVTEICWALKWAATQATWSAASVPIVLNFGIMGLLGFAMRTLPAGTAYAVWTGLGAVGVAVMGSVLLGEKLNSAQFGFMALIITGVVGTKLFATT